MPEQSYQPQINLTAYESSAKQKRVLRVLLAFSVLAVFVLALMYYAWFGNSLPGATNQSSASKSDTTAEKARRAGPAASRRANSRHHADKVVLSTSEAASKAQLRSVPGITESTIRSPLALEVVSGTGHHQLIGTRDDSIYLDSHDKTPAARDMADASAADGSVIKAAAQSRISSGVVELPSPSGSADALLAKQQTMEGSVVLLAQVDKEGNIKNVHAISGPEILFAAAREAVKQWRFKPYYESGQAVESETEITVKFAISAH